MFLKATARNLRRPLPVEGAEQTFLEEIFMLRRKASAAAVAVALTGAALGYVGNEFFPIAQSHAVTAPRTAQPGQSLPDFSELVETQGAAVVNIVAVGKEPAAARPELPFQPGDPMYEFFRRFQIPIPDVQPGPRQGQGSGFIISPDGYILTNAHVVAEATDVTVKLTDKRELKAKVIGVDRRTDLAVLKVDATNLPTVRIGDPAKLKVGEWVAAIGAPFGLENTVTAGIVSAKSRSLRGDSYVPFIQTDVAINPGNSGGPLFNMAGEVVGINSQIYSRTGGYMGLSFSIPIDAAMKVKDDLVRYGKVSRGRIGVTIQSVTKDLAESFGLDKPSGVLVTAVEPGSPAAKAGLQSGDVILSVNGRSLDESAELARAVGETKPGTSLSLHVWRDRAARDVRVTVGETPAEKVAAAATPEEAKPGKLGVTVRPLTAEERKARGVTEGGVVVEEVDGPAAKAGIRRGDVILAFGNDKVENADQLKRLTDKASGSIALLVKREDATIYVSVKLS
jgi:serine protease Do